MDEGKAFRSIPPKTTSLALLSAIQGLGYAGTDIWHVLLLTYICLYLTYSQGGLHGHKFWLRVPCYSGHPIET